MLHTWPVCGEVYTSSPGVWFMRTPLISFQDLMNPCSPIQRPLDPAQGSRTACCSWLGLSFSPWQNPIQEGQSSVLRCREMRGMELLGQRLIIWAGKKLKTGVDPHCVRIIKTLVWVLLWDHYGYIRDFYQQKKNYIFLNYNYSKLLTFHHISSCLFNIAFFFLNAAFCIQSSFLFQSL